MAFWYFISQLATLAPTITTTLNPYPTVAVKLLLKSYFTVWNSNYNVYLQTKKLFVIILRERFRGCAVTERNVISNYLAKNFIFYKRNRPRIISLL